MFKKPISLAVMIVGTSAFAWVAACSSDNKSNGSPSSTGNGTSGHSSSSASSGSTGSGGGTSAGSNSSGDGGSGTPNTDGGGSCVASGTLIDDQSAPMGTALSGVKPSATCPASTGTWYDYQYTGAGGTAGTLTPPQGMFTFSARPAGLDAGAPTGDGGAPKAACISGVTSAAIYSGAGLGFNFGTGPAPGDGGFAPAIPFDTSSHTGGFKFWTYGGGDAATQTVAFGVFDKTTSPYGGVCDPSSAATPATACAPLSAAITIPSGWTQQTVNWTDLVANPGYGIPDTLDQTKIYTVQWQVQQSVDPDAGGAPLPFSFCIANISFF